MTKRKLSYTPPSVSRLGSTASLTENQSETNADDLQVANSANPFVPPPVPPVS